MSKVLKYLDKKDWAKIAFSFIFVIIQVYLELKIPDYMTEMTTAIQTEGTVVGDVIGVGVYMLLCALGGLGGTIVVGFFAAQVAASLATRLRELQYDKVEAFSMDEINQFSIPSLINRTTNDITQVQMLMAMGLNIIMRAPVMVVFAVVKIANKSWQWTAATGVAVMALLLIVLIIITLAMPKFKTIQTLNDNVNNITRENLTGIRVVRAYNAEGYQKNKFERANKTLTDTNLFTTRIMAIMQPGMSLIMTGLTLAIYIIGAVLINGADMMGRISLFSDMVVFSSYAMQIVISFMMLVMIFMILPRASVAAKRIAEVIETKISITDGKGVTETAEEGTIEFKDVTFHYADASENVLEHISFTAKKGEVVAVIGSTGSGKSTLVDMIPRFYDATEGSVCVDGVDVRDYTLEQLHNKIGYVSQKAVMFAGDVSSNVAYGDNGKGTPSEEEIKTAIEIAQGTEFVEKMDGAYHAHIAQGGTNVSGGQKQRLSIARAICRKAEILLFDDSFSALDYKTDSKLRGILNERLADTTRIIVAQRIGTIKDADKIIVLDQGKIVGMGKHDDLMNDCEVYRAIAYSQLSKEELA